MSKAIYPGSFDPVTLGHVDIIERSCVKFEKLYVAVMENEAKRPLFTLEEKIDMLKKETAHLPNVEIVAGSGLTVDFARSVGADTIIRGLRVMSDFEYEMQQSTYNMLFAPELETFFLMAKPQYSFLSSSAAKTVASFGGDLSALVPAYVAEKMREKYRQKQ